MTSQIFKTEFSYCDVRFAPTVAGSRLGAAVRAVAELVRLWWVRAEGRRALRDLDAHLLKDIGLTRSQALGEAAKPFWRC